MEMDEFLKEINADIFWKYIKAYDFNENMQVLKSKKVFIYKSLLEGYNKS